MTAKSLAHLTGIGAPGAVQSLGSVADPLNGASPPRSRILCLNHSADLLGSTTNVHAFQQNNSFFSNEPIMILLTSKRDLDPGRLAHLDVCRFYLFPFTAANGIYCAGTFQSTMGISFSGMDHSKNSKKELKRGNLWPHHHRISMLLFLISLYCAHPC